MRQPATALVLSGSISYVSGMDRSISSHPAVAVAAKAPSIAVLIPCHNEAATIARVVADFSTQLPGCSIYVYDNNSSDDTARLAREAGALVRLRTLAGQRQRRTADVFPDIEADIFILVDGDGTYDSHSAPRLVDLIVTHRGLDMVNCLARLPVTQTAFRLGHAFGNRVLTGLVAWIFGNRMGDILSGYRAMSRRFVKSFPALSSGFEIETELTVHALEMRVPIARNSGALLPSARRAQRASCQNVARRDTDLEAHRAPGQRGAPAKVFHGHIRFVERGGIGPRLARHSDLFGDTSGPETADRGSRHRPGDPGGLEPGVRPGAGYRNARTTRIETPFLSIRGPGKLARPTSDQGFCRWKCSPFAPNGRFRSSLDSW